MAQVEIYKLRKTVPREIRECSAFDFMYRGTAPDPAHYTKEWEGQMHGTLPLTIPGRLMLETPKDYHGGDIKNGDIAVVNGTPFYFDKLEGSKFIELDTFDGSKVREALHVDYGWFVDIKGARPISYEIANVCLDINVPCGYLGTHSAGGAFSSVRPFLPGVSGEEYLNFLHPQFLMGDDAREFIESLAELLEAEPDKWSRIQSYLRERSPINLQDLQDAKAQYAPELLLPFAVRTLYKHIPIDADKWEIAYLADKIDFLDKEQLAIFNAVTHIGWQCSNVAEIINLAETLDCFELHPAHNEEIYGDFCLERDWGQCEAVINRLEKSEDPAEREVAKYISYLNRAADPTAYGYNAMKEEGGVFTPYGLLTTEGSGEPRTVYRGTQDLPAGYRTTQPTPETERDTATHAESAERIAPGDKPSVLAEIAEARIKPPDPRNKSDPAPSKKKSDPEH